MSVDTIPRATCRLQLRKEFDFIAASAVVSYLARLGISHAYCSSWLKARAGSQHGYDIIDHNAFNPELGGEAGFTAFRQELERHGMGQILDLVPNHMAVGDDNDWWLEVLEHGPCAPHADYFDIDWRPVKASLRGKVLLPVLGTHYGTVLAQGELSLVFDAESGQFNVHYHQQRFPLDPATCTVIFEHCNGRCPDPLADIINALGGLPPRDSTDPQQGRERVAAAQDLKARLVDAFAQSTEVRDCVNAGVAAINGMVGDTDSFDALHDLLEQQAWRLAFWQVASDDINYRRFFDINDLAGLRMERDEVFESTHAMVLDLVRRGWLDGLRIDHPDGLHDPAAYYHRLTRRMSEAAPGNRAPYVVVEKILAAHESLPETWPVAGTTGYEFAAQLNSLLVDPAGERSLTRIYRRFTGMTRDFDELLYERKHLVIRRQLSSELTVLANMLAAIAEMNRDTRDYTLNGLREALAEITACFPVYRTYVADGEIARADLRHIDWAVSQALRRSTASDPAIFGFIRSVLVLEAGPRQQVRRVAMKFQQYTAPVTAKAMEDTVFYIYDRLVSLNEVGGDPRRFGLPVGGFHHHNQERLRCWPHAMLNTSTHDGKRSEDVRARLHVLSELPDEWRRCLTRWRRLNRSRKRLIDDARAPSDNDEYLLYQTLLGVWPLAPADDAGLGALCDRVTAYMIKAAREAKVRTSWINPNAEYEEAIDAFIAALLKRPDRNAFLADFQPFAARIAHFGLCNSLVQVALKFCAPGVPDLYQGNELWTFQLVDPDNRASIDYPLRIRMLDRLVECFGERARGQGQALRALFEDPADGQAKLYLTWRALQLRGLYPLLFRDGDYIALEIDGPRSDQVCAFARQRDDEWMMVITPLFFTRLTQGRDRFEPDPEVWAGTVVHLPDGAPMAWRDVLSGETVTMQMQDDKCSQGLGTFLQYFPVALLVGEQAAAREQTF